MATVTASSTNSSVSVTSTSTSSTASVTAVYGQRGKSAYEVAIDNGFVGTEAEWLASLQIDAENLVNTEATARQSADNTIAETLNNLKDTILITGAAYNGTTYASNTTYNMLAVTGTGSKFYGSVHQAPCDCTITKATLTMGATNGTFTGNSSLYLVVGNTSYLMTDEFIFSAAGQQVIFDTEISITTGTDIYFKMVTGTLSGSPFGRYSYSVELEK